MTLAPRSTKANVTGERRASAATLAEMKCDVNTAVTIVNLIGIVNPIVLSLSLITNVVSIFIRLSASDELMTLDGGQWRKTRTTT